jgi:hypothetical protein
MSRSASPGKELLLGKFRLARAKPEALESGCAQPRDGDVGDVSLMDLGSRIGEGF